MKIEKVKFDEAVKFIVENSGYTYNRRDDLSDSVLDEIYEIDSKCSKVIELNGTHFKVYRYEPLLINSEFEEYKCLCNVEKI